MGGGLRGARRQFYRPYLPRAAAIAMRAAGAPGAVARLGPPSGILSIQAHSQRGFA